MAQKIERPRARARLLVRINRLAAGSSEDVKPVGRGVSELRISDGPGYRIHHLHDGDRISLLLIGGNKSRQDADIPAAYQIADEWRGSRP